MYVYTLYLDKMLPVDEYIPIMYNRHPNTTWANFFRNNSVKTNIIYTAFLNEMKYMLIKYLKILI